MVELGEGDGCRLDTLLRFLRVKVGVISDERRETCLQTYH